MENLEPINIPKLTNVLSENENSQNNQPDFCQNSIDTPKKLKVQQQEDGEEDELIGQKLNTIYLRKRSSFLCISELNNSDCVNKDCGCQHIHKSDPSYSFGLLYHKIQKKSSQKKGIKSQEKLRIRGSMKKFTSIGGMERQNSVEILDDQTTMAEISGEENIVNNKNQLLYQSEPFQQQELLISCEKKLFQSEKKIPLTNITNNQNINDKENINLTDKYIDDLYCIDDEIIEKEELVCQICDSEYDMDSIPVSLKCGHHLCYTCLQQVKSEKSLNKYYMQNQQRQNLQNIQNLGRQPPLQINQIQQRLSQFQQQPFNNYQHNNNINNLLPFQQPQQFNNPILSQQQQFQKYNQENVNINNFQDSQEQQLFSKVMKYHNEHSINDEEFKELQNKISEKIIQNGEQFFKEEIEKYSDIQCPFCRVNINKGSEVDLEVNVALLKLSLKSQTSIELDP